MKRPTPRQRPSRVILDPVTLEPAGFIVEIQTACRTCDRGRLIEVYDEEGQLVRREAHGQLCWHWRANQPSPETPLSGGVDKTSDEVILKHGRR